MNISVASEVNDAVLYPCFPRGGCVGGSVSAGAVCATGYTGPLCASCSHGWAGHAGVCERCLPTGVLAFGLGSVALLLWLALGFAVAIILQTGLPTDPTVRSVSDFCPRRISLDLSLDV